MADLPEDFLKTMASISSFAQTLGKLKRSVQEGKAVRLYPDECQSLIWGFQVMKQGPSRDG